MAKVILICGKICCGKSTYAEQLRLPYRAALLSVDEITLALFGQYCGDKHDEYGRRTQRYLFDKSLKLLEAGINVILDWGFWTRADRESARSFYQDRGIACEIHYIDISEETWSARLHQRNAAILERTNGAIAEETKDYFVDENLAAKVAARFEVPGEEEIDVWVRQ